MKQRTAYTWEQSDPSITFVTEALNRLQSFREPVGQDAAYETSYNKVVKGNDFTAEDVENVSEYLNVVAERARAKWKDTKMAEGCKPEFVASVLQAADNADQVAQGLISIFYQGANAPVTDIQE